VDGQLVIDNWDGPLLKGKAINLDGAKRFSADVVLQAGKRYAFWLEYRERGTYQSVQLTWQSQRQMPEIIPQSQLFPGQGFNRKTFLPVAMTMKAR
jgi:hypothetical protein